MPEASPSGPTSRPSLSARRGRLLFEEFTGELSLDAVRGRVALLADYQRRVHRWFTLSAAMGILVGILVGGLHVLIEDLLLERLVLHSPWPLVLILPTIGLALAHQALRAVPGIRNPETTERYIAAFHQPRERLRLRDLWGRLLASVMTIGSGGSLGLEGPSLLTGASIGAHLQPRFPRVFAGEDARLLMVAGAAAGVSAIFRAPLTGVVFALEVPFKDDIARHAVLPALVASATGYLGQSIFFGTQPLLPVGRVPAFTSRDVVATIVVGVACGAGARLFVRALHPIRRATSGWSSFRRIAVGGSVTGLAGVIAMRLFGAPDVLGIGYPAVRAIAASQAPYDLAWALALFLVLKAVATGATIVGGGAGGVFIPLVIMGAAVGGLSAELVGGVIPGLDVELFPLVGMAAFLGAGYHTPLAAVAFVAETTGSSNYIVAGLLAAAFAYGVMGRRSISTRQRTARRGHVEALLDEAAANAISGPPVTVPPDATLEAFIRDYVFTAKHREYPVATDGRLLGMIALDHLHDVDPAQWPKTRIADVMDRDVASVPADAPLQVAAEVMNQTGMDRVPIVDAHGRVVGVIGPRDIFRFGELLEDIQRSAS
ncbi:MAG: chloride channel protein [Nitriliruptorales bacterium]